MTSTSKTSKPKPTWCTDSSCAFSTHMTTNLCLGVDVICSDMPPRNERVWNCTGSAHISGIHARCTCVCHSTPIRPKSVYL